VSPGATFAVLPSYRHRKHPLASLLLAFALLLAQSLLAVHGIEHLAHDADEHLCELCLAGAPLGAALAEAPPEIASSAVPPLPRADALTRPALPVPFNPHLPRAPPAADAT
jgi:hypothetical protein